MRHELRSIRSEHEGKRQPLRRPLPFLCGVWYTGTAGFGRGSVCGQQHLEALDRERPLVLIEIYVKNWLDMDSVWFQSVEERWRMEDLRRALFLRLYACLNR